MKRCAHCGGKFGMVRRTAFRLIGGTVQFCSRKCEEDYAKARQQEVRVLQFLQWLHAKPP